VGIDNDQNFLRHVGGSHIHGDVINGSAFERAPKDVDGVSIAIRGVFSDDTQTDVAKIREVVGARRKLGRTSVFAELNVGAALSVLHEFEEAITIVLEPLSADDDGPEDPSHALILGLPFQGEAIGSLKSELAGDLLARRIICTYPAIV
jgi:hypothetical protein